VESKIKDLENESQQGIRQTRSIAVFLALPCARGFVFLVCVHDLLSKESALTFLAQKNSLKHQMEIAMEIFPSSIFFFLCLMA